MGEFHRERSKAGRDGAQFRRVVAQLRETRASCHYARILPTVSCDDMTVPLCQVRQHHTELMLVNHYLQNETRVLMNDDVQYLLNRTRHQQTEHSAHFSATSYFFCSVMFT